MKEIRSSLWLDGGGRFQDNKSREGLWEQSERRHRGVCVDVEGVLEASEHTSGGKGRLWGRKAVAEMGKVGWARL